MLTNIYTTQFLGQASLRYVKWEKKFKMSSAGSQKYTVIPQCNWTVSLIKLSLPVTVELVLTVHLTSGQNDKKHWDSNMAEQ